MNKKLNSLIYSSVKDTRSLFICLMTIEFIVMMAILFFSHGTLNKWFFSGSNSPKTSGVDFFICIHSCVAEEPYEMNRDQYPPLAKLFFRGVRHFLPLDLLASLPNRFHSSMCGTNNDLRIYQHAHLMFILFLVVFVVFFLFLIETYLKEYLQARYFAVACCLTHGVLFGIDRGNIILMSLVLSFAFLAGYNSSRPVIRELALLSLAAAANLKLYPALFGLLLLREKKWKLAFHAVIYGILLFLLPLKYYGGLQAIGYYIKNVTGFGSSSGDYGLNIKRFAGFLNDYSFINIQDINPNIFKKIVAAVLLAGILASKKRWEQCLFIIMIIVLFQQSYLYVLSFYLLPFLLLCKEAPDFSEHSVERICMLMLLSIVPFVPVVSGYNLSTFSAMLAHSCIWIVCVGIVWKEMKAKIKACKLHVQKE